MHNQTNQLEILMKKMFVIFVLMLSGCVTRSVIVNQAPDKFEAVVVSGKCDSLCKKSLSQKFNMRIGPYGAFSGPATLLKFGLWEGYEYNYKLILKPGIYPAVLSVNNYMATSPKTTSLTVNLERGNEYFFGQIIKSTYASEGRIYKWHPVLFNYTKGVIEYPTGELDWLGNLKD